MEISKVISKMQKIKDMFGDIDVSILVNLQISDDEYSIYSYYPEDIEIDVSEEDEDQYILYFHNHQSPLQI